MNFDAQLRKRLEEIRERNLFRQLREVQSPQSARIRIEGRDVLNFSSNDYLGLANHPLVTEAAAEAARNFGAGAGASRLVCGSTEPLHELERALAEFKGTEAALVFSSGYSAAIGTISSLVGPGDVVAVDKRVHASLIDGARLSGARLRIFGHNNLESLKGILDWAGRADTRRGCANRSADDIAGDPTRRPCGNVLIVTESVFSMDGDFAPLRDLVELKERFGAWLMVDEAHATGLYGKKGSGLVDAFGLSGRVDVQMGTLGKALGAAGGFVAGSRALIDFLVNSARSFIFSTAPVPAAAAAARAALRIVQSAEGDERRKAMWERVSQVQGGFCPDDDSRNTDIPPSGLPATLSPSGGERDGNVCATFNKPNSGEGAGFRSAILPVRIGLEAEALRVSRCLMEARIFIPAIRFPTVPRGQARLRLTLSAAHSEDDVAQLLEALRQIQFEPLRRP